MSAFYKFVLAALLCQSVLAGCARTTADQISSKPKSEFLLTAEPAGARDVIDIRDEAKDGQPVVVLGRIGGGVKPWIDGRAAFILVDERMLATCDGEACEADCAQCAQELASATTMVKFVDGQGKVLPVDARELLGLKEEQTVVIRGVASRDKSGNVSIVADGLYVRT